MKNNDVLLSICIPTYNRAQIVYECVNNCLKNDVDWIEVCVTDNCSTDNTKEILTKINDKRFSYYCNEKNIGYENLTMCLKNGSGKWCLLLSDEDNLFDINWDLLHDLLEMDNSVTVYQFEYFDSNGNQLLSGPELTFEKNTYENYQFCKNNFAYAGGTLLLHKTINAVWDNIPHTDLLWSLYSEILIPLWCSYYGQTKKMPYIKARRSERDGKGTIDVKTWNGSGADPYWSLKSRKEQNKIWFSRIRDLPCSNECKYRLLLRHRLDSINCIYTYYCIIHNDELLKTPLFQKRWDIIEHDKEYNCKTWLKLFSKNAKEMNLEFKTVTKGMKHFWRLDFLHFLKQKKLKFTIYAKVIIKEIFYNKFER